MFEKPANLPLLSKHGVQFILIKQPQRFWKTHTLITFCLVLKSSPAQVGDEKTWKSPQRCNFFPQNRLYLDLMSTTTTEFNNLVINNVQIKDRSILDEEVVCKYFHINTSLSHLVWNISIYSHGMAIAKIIPLFSIIMQNLQEKPFLCVIMRRKWNWK